MIKVYLDGDSFILENKEFLDLNKYMSSLIYLDADAMIETNKTNYIIKSEINNKKLIGIKLEPFNLLLYGDRDCLDELLKFINENEYELKGVMCPTILGDSLIPISKDILNKEYTLVIGMDFMEANEYTMESSSLVSSAALNDLEEIYNMTLRFIKDCGLNDVPNKDKMALNIKNYRIIKINDEIRAMAAYSKDTDSSYRITHVYTKDEYRGNGYAKLIVNNLKNEILSLGKIATLNVDQKNPISNHIYKSIGFKRVFSQGIYELKN
jgi:predicted GNAT family acetyltransferase